MGRMTTTLLAVVVCLLAYALPASAQQVFAPGRFVIDGIPVSCGPLPTIVTSSLPDVAMNNGQAILVNASAFFALPTFIKLFIYAHECGHYVVGMSEDGADCFATKLGRDQGWFPPNAFRLLIAAFRDNPGDWTHRPGPARLRNMTACYQSP
jgi:hypothetical protein